MTLGQLVIGVLLTLSLIHIGLEIYFWVTNSVYKIHQYSSSRHELLRLFLFMIGAVVILLFFTKFLSSINWNKQIF